MSLQPEFQRHFHRIHWFGQLRSNRSKALKILILCPHVLVAQLQGKFICDQGDEFGIRGFSLGVGNGIFLCFQNFLR